MDRLRQNPLMSAVLIGLGAGLAVGLGTGHLFLGVAVGLGVALLFGQVLSS